MTDPTIPDADRDAVALAIANSDPESFPVPSTNPEPWRPEADYAIRALIARGWTKPQWIPCSERMPDIDHEVLVHIYGGEIAIMWRSAIGSWKDEQERYCIPDQVTHWMPLPATTTAKETP